MRAFKVPRLPRRRTLAAAIAAGVVGSGAVGSFFVTAAPASAQVIWSCNPPHTDSWAKLYPNYIDWLDQSSPIGCFGFVSDNPQSTLAQVFCAGNNKGTVYYRDVYTNTWGLHTFWPGGSYEVVNGTYTQSVVPNPDLIEVHDIQITGYSGSATCLLAIPASAAPGAVSGSRECPSCPSDTEQRAPRTKSGSRPRPVGHRPAISARASCDILLWLLLNQ